MKDSSSNDYNWPANATNLIWILMENWEEEEKKGKAICAILTEPQNERDKDAAGNCSHEVRICRIFASIYFGLSLVLGLIL